MLQPGNVLDKPIQVGNDESDKMTDHVSAIQVLWPEQPYCSPVKVDSCTDNSRTVGCPVEVYVGIKPEATHLSHWTGLNY